MIRSYSNNRVHQSSSMSSDTLSVVPGTSTPMEGTEKAYLQLGKQDIFYCSLFKFFKNLSLGYRYLMDAIANWERAANFGKFHVNTRKLHKGVIYPIYLNSSRSLMKQTCCQVWREFWQKPTNCIKAMRDF